MEYRLILSKKELKPYFPQLMQARQLAVDTETTGLDPHTNRLRLIQLYAKGLPVLVLDCTSFLPEGKGLLIELFDEKRVKVFQNAKFDLQFLQANGIGALPEHCCVPPAGRGAYP